MATAGDLKGGCGRGTSRAEVAVAVAPAVASCWGPPAGPSSGAPGETLRRPLLAAAAEAVPPQRRRGGSRGARQAHPPAAILHSTHCSPLQRTGAGRRQPAAARSSQTPADRTRQRNSRPTADGDEGYRHGRITDALALSRPDIVPISRLPRRTWCLITEDDATGSRRTQDLARRVLRGTRYLAGREAASMNRGREPPAYPSREPVPCRAAQVPSLITPGSPMQKGGPSRKRRPRRTRTLAGHAGHPRWS